MYKTTGTLKEIGAKVGDVVQRVGYEPYLAPLTRNEIETDTRGGFRIISRATPALPVRTVIKKEIVPGVYGRLKIGRTAIEQVDMSVSGWFSKYDLTDLINTLTEIRDEL